MRSLLRFAALLGVLYGTQAAAVAPPRPFIIVAEPIAPYEYADETGEPAGINVEILDHVFQKLGVPYEIRFYPWSRAWLMIVNGAADAILSVSYQKQREPYLHFTQEQTQFWKTGHVPPDFLWLTEYVFFINRRLAETVQFTSYQQLEAEKLRIAINNQYSYDTDLLEARIPRITKHSSREAMNSLLDGKADLYPMDRTCGWALLKQQNLHDRITWLPKPLFMKPYLMGFSRQSDYPDVESLMQRFHTEIRAMRKSGTIETITARHVDPIRPPRPNRKLRFVCEDWRPFEYEEEGQMQGLNVEIVERIMTALRVPYEIRSYPWPRAWIMAERGQADAVLSVSYHADREKALYYTDGQREAAQQGALPRDYLWISRYAFFTKNNHHELTSDYQTILESRWRVGINQGYSYVPTFPADQFAAKLYFDTESGFMGLIKEEIDLYPMDLTVGAVTLSNMGLEESIKPLPEVLFSKAYLAPFVKSSDYPGLEGIMYEFYHHLRQLRASGALTN